MTVLYPGIRGSGVEVYTERLVAGLASLGWKGQLLRFSPAWEYFPWGLRLVWNRQVPQTRDCDLVHVNADYGCYFSVAGKPLVATLHHSSIDALHLSSLSFPIRWHHRLVLKPSVGKTLRQASALVAVSQNTRDTICEAFQQELPIRVIPNGIDTMRFRPASSEQLSADCGGTASEAPVFRTLSTESNKNDRPIVLFFSGNPSHRKGADLFVPVMKQLGSEYELRATSGLRGVSASLFDAPNIRCLGHLSENELIRQINQADISFQPSRREGFGLSILEAMACGKPVVSSNVSAIPEVLEHEKGGYLCEPGSVDQLVNAIRKLAHSKLVRSEMGRFNRRVVEEKFTLERMAQAYHALYQTVAGESPDPNRLCSRNLP
jgi:glycosyltransferase involved in cell wall biosynthesis